MAEPNTLILYSRRGCHLCEAAEAMLLRLGLSPRVVDVDTDVDLQLRYSDLVPVVAVNGEDVLAGIISETQARRALATLLGRAPRLT